MGDRLLILILAFQIKKEYSKHERFTHKLKENVYLRGKKTSLRWLGSPLLLIRDLTFSVFS